MILKREKDIPIFWSAVLAGISISIGATAYLIVDSKILGAFLFTIGLLMVKVFRLMLFTGKIAYLFEPDKVGLTTLQFPIIWCGNLLGAVLTAELLSITRIYPLISDKANVIFKVKIDDSIGSIFCLAIFCNILVYVAVTNIEGTFNYIIPFIAIPIFIICGFEHCVADMYYGIIGAFCVNGENMIHFGEYLGVILISTLGNAVGAVAFHHMLKISRD